MSATTAVLRAEARLFTREPASLFWIVLFPTVLMVIIGLVPASREASDDLGGQRLVDLYVPISVLLALVMASVSAMPAVLAAYRETGVLRRFRASPVHPGTLLLGQVVVHAVAVLASIVLVLGVGRLAWDVALPQAVAWWVVSLLLAVAASFAVGAVITAVAGTTRAVQTLSTVVLFPSMFTAGVWLPVTAMEGLLRDVITLTPLGAAAEALTATAAGQAPALLDLVVVLGWGVVLGAIAVRVFRWE